MIAQELREKYLEFFKSKEHSIISSSSLIPENDPTVLFITAGMQPLVPFLKGETHPNGNKLTSIQKCIRTGDIEEVGDSTHHTFFEMLGNWSLGDYFKKESIKMSFEFLTKKLKLLPERLAVSVFAGDNDAPFDQESFDLWKSLGIDEKRIAKLPKKNNWWGPAGTTGPCGPDTEIFYWTGDKRSIPEGFNDDNDMWVEIWNNVFMEYDKQEDGSYQLLKQKNVDTGMGLERILAVINKVDDNYKTELWENLIKGIEDLSGKKYGESAEITKAIRIIADHIKASVFIIGDKRGVTPSNLDQGYVVRRLLRRAVVYSQRIGIPGGDLADLATVVINDYSEVYPELEANYAFIVKNIAEEEEKFERTLENGLKEFNKKCNDLSCAINEQTAGMEITMPGYVVFNLFTTHGFPIELIEEIARERDMKVDMEGFREEFKKHQDLSRTASAGMFKGGLADNSNETKNLHTAAHLLLASLRKVLGDHVEQKGSNITAERLRFDFSHPDKLTPEEIEKVENLVNGAIERDLEVTFDNKTVVAAKDEGALGVFDSKYGEKVKVYTMGDFSKEICGGPHAERTSHLGKFTVKKESSSSAGVRRIKAVLS